MTDQPIHCYREREEKLLMMMILFFCCCADICYDDGKSGPCYSYLCPDLHTFCLVEYFVALPTILIPVTGLMERYSLLFNV